jgi:hypothetical protein
LSTPPTLPPTLPPNPPINPPRQQDADLEDIEAAVTRLGRVGLTIHQELETQARRGGV